MNLRGLKQVDIQRKCEPYCEKFGVKMNKSDLSQYVSGKVEPSQYKLMILGMALNVSEAWLMGFDVPMKKELSSSEAEGDIELIEKFSLLSERDKQLVMNMIDSMLPIQKK